MNLFLPDAGLVIWMLIAFGLVFFLLAKFAWPSIIRSVEQRQQHINESLEKADEAVKTLATLEQKGKDIIAAAQAEQMRMIQETKTLNDQMVNEAKTKAQAEAQKIIEEAHAQIRRDKQQAIEDIRKEVAVLSIGIAEKVLKKELDDKKAQSQYIDRLLKEDIIQAQS